MSLPGGYPNPSRLFTYIGWIDFTCLKNSYILTRRSRLLIPFSACSYPQILLRRQFGSSAEFVGR